MARLQLQPALLLLMLLLLQWRRRTPPQTRARGAGWRGSAQGSFCRHEKMPQGSMTRLLL